MTLIFSIVEFKAVVEARKHKPLQKIFVCIRKRMPGEEGRHEYKNFKYYIMDYDEKADTCSVKFGRIGYAPQHHEYGFKEGQKKELEKRRKGYKELSDDEYEAMFASYGNLQND